jgi:hypothetical protein
METCNWGWRNKKGWIRERKTEGVNETTSLRWPFYSVLNSDNGCWSVIEFKASNNRLCERAHITQETCIWMSNGSMNATISFKKAINWSGTYQKSELIQGNQAFLVSCNRYEAHPFPCQIWMHVVHSVWEKKEIQNFFQRHGSGPTKRHISIAAHQLVWRVTCVRTWITHDAKADGTAQR